MIKPEQSEIAVDLIRKNARMMRRDSSGLIRRVNYLVEAQEALIPDQLLLPFSCFLRKAIEGTRFDMAALPSSVTSLFNKNRRCAAENLGALRAFGVRIRREFGDETENAVLSGDGAVLSGLYQDSGAYPATFWAALLRDGTCANGSKPKLYRPPADEWSEMVQFGNSIWRRPKPPFLVALLAAHVGDAATSPEPPMWPHLGLALLVYRDRVNANQVLELAARLSQQEEAERGLAIAAHIFPELSKWLAAAELGIPKWERKFAIPLAARRLVLGERD